MKKLLIGLALLLLLLSVPIPVHAYYHLDVEWNRDQIIKMCNELYEDYTGMRYFCIMANFYALNKINDHYYDYQENEEAIAVLNDLIVENYLEALESVNFVAVDRDFNRYLESR